MSHHNDDDLKVKSRDNRAFDIKAFHQLRLELLESQRIVNQERMKRQVLRSPPRVRLVVGSTFRSPSVVDFPSSTDIPQTTNIFTGVTKRESFGANEAYDDNNLSFARQELLRLGRRYSSFQETPPLTTHTNYTGSLDLTRDTRQALFPETTFLASPMRASGHLDAQMSTKGIGIPGFYLLLARTHFPSNHENSINDDEDGSNSESYSTPTAPHLPTSSDKDISYDQQDGTKFDHYFSSFSAAHLLRSELEDKSLKSLRRTDHEYRMQQQKRKMNQRMKKIIKVSSSALAALAVLFCWRYTLNWRTHAQLDKTISVQYSAFYQSMQHSYWPMKTRFEKRVDQLLCLREHNTTLHLLSWPKLRRINPVSVFTEWRQHIDRISCIIQSVYRIQKGYQDALAIAVAAKYKCLGVRRNAALTAAKTTKHNVLGFPLVAWNSSLAFFSTLWRSLTCAELADTSHRFEPHQFGRSLLTSPVLDWLDDDDVSISGQNDTMWLLDCAEVAEPAIGTMFWRKSIKLPFLRKQSPLNRQSYLHSIPSFEAVQADSSDLICSVPLPSKMNKRGITHQPILLSRPHLVLKNPRVDSIAISLEKNQTYVSASTMKRDYYESSYPFAEQCEGKNIFEDVDVMSMMHEFIGNVLQRQLARRTVEHGIPMKHSL
jgi:hypothetical protein